MRDTASSAPYGDLPTTRRLVSTEWTDEDLRSRALSAAFSFFELRRTATTAQPVQASTVMEMAEHFVAYLRDGTIPEANGG